MKNYLSVILLGIFVSLLVSCNGLYDDPDDFVDARSEAQSYLNVNCCSYTQWVYFNLHSHDSITLAYDAETVPIEWDIAIHRYDVKTCGCSAFETDYQSINALRNNIASGRFCCPGDSLWVADVVDSITIDMSHMMDGYLLYAPSLRNRVLGRWLDVDLGSMPPVYTPSGKVYLIRMNDGTYAAIRFTGYSNPQKYNTKGYISFDYLYPLSFNP